MIQLSKFPAWISTLYQLLDCLVIIARKNDNSANCPTFTRQDNLAHVISPLHMIQILSSWAIPRMVIWGVVYLYGIFMFICHKDKTHFSPTKEIRNLKHEHIIYGHPPIVILGMALLFILDDDAILGVLSIFPKLV